jgi:hypothetical protein
LSPPVFISYAWATSSSQAVALYEALKGTEAEAFLDDVAVAPPEEIPGRLAEALLSARVVVAFVDTAYFAENDSQPSAAWTMSARRCNASPPLAG